MEEMKIQNFQMNFRPRFDACISGNTQPIDLKLKTLVNLDFANCGCSFLCWGHRIDAVLFRPLAQRTTKVGFVVVGIPSLINLDSVDSSEYKSRVSLFTGWVVDLVGMSLIDYA